MGITGLIPFMEKSSRKASVSEFAGSMVAVDAYCWLHKGTYSCIEQLVNGEPCKQYINYCVNLARMLQSHKVHPILVFDGRHLPAKAETEKKRRQSREQSRKRAAELLRAGLRAEARSFLQRCLDITHEHALAVITAVRSLGIDCIVAPYESDSQMAFLNLNNIVQLVITEDSDLVLFGCNKIMFKMDSTGSGILVERDRLYLSMGIRQDLFSLDMFRHMAILSGCDYLSSLPGIGLGKACKFIKQARGFEIYRALLRLPQVLKMNLRVPDDYRDEFLLADYTFRYQIVYDPIKRKQCYLTEPEPGLTPPNCVGEIIDDDMKAYQMALGNLEPFTLEKVDDWNPVNKPVRPLGGFTSIWDRKFKTRPQLRRSPRKHVSPMKTFSKVIQCNVDKLVSKIEKRFESVENEDLANIYGAKTDELSPKKEEPLREKTKENLQEIKKKQIEKCENEKVEKEKSEEIPIEKRLASPKKVLDCNISENKGVKRSADGSPTNESFQAKRNNTNPSPKRNPFFKSPANEISPNLLGLNKFKSNIVIKSRYFHNNKNPPRTRTSLFKKTKNTEEKEAEVVLVSETPTQNLFDEVVMVPETPTQDVFNEVVMVPETPTQDVFDEVPETQSPEKLSQLLNATCIVNETPDDTGGEILLVPETPQNESLDQDILLVPETVPTEILIVPETPETESYNPDILVIPETAQTESPGNDIPFIFETPPDESNESSIIESSFSKKRTKLMPPPPTSPIISRYNKKKKNIRPISSTQSTLAMFGFKSRNKI